MPGRRGIGPIDNKLCRRCQTQPPTITVRNEPLCTACFSKYVSTKVVKRMETFRVRHAEPGQERTLLLPISFGYASVSLLHILSQHLKVQAEKSGRSGYRLHALHVREDDASADKLNVLLDGVRSRFAQHTYSTIPLSDALDLATVDSLDAPGEVMNGSEPLRQQRLHLLLNSLDSATSRADLVQILKRKLIISFAKTNECSAIIWGDSTTKLAERTLAETAKGRGFSLPEIVADGEAQQLAIPSYRPMRDLRGKEIAAFASLIDPPLNDLIFLEEETRPAVSLRNTTIDDLMRQYFESAELEYPNIVTNVVRTAGKLRALELDEVEGRCELCEMPLSSGSAPEKSRLCYGCIRTLPQAIG